jgi:hypothetical protein
MATEEIKLRITTEIDPRPVDKAAKKTKAWFYDIQKSHLKIGKAAAKGTKEYKAQIQHQIKIARALDKIRKQETARLAIMKKQRQEADKMRQAMALRALAAPGRAMGAGMRGLFSVPTMVGGYLGGRAARFGYERFIGANVEYERSQAMIDAMRFRETKERRANIHEHLQSLTGGYGMTRAGATLMGARLMPYTKGMGEFKGLTELMAQTQLALPHKSQEDVLFAFKEAMAGQYISLMRRMDVPADVIHRLKESGASNIEILRGGMGAVGVTKEVIAAQRKTLGYQIKATQARMSDMFLDVGQRAFMRLKEGGGKTFTQRLDAIMKTRSFQKFLEDASLALGELVDWLLTLLDQLPSAFKWLQENWEMIKTVTKGMVGLLIVNKVSAGLGVFGAKLGGAVGGLLALYTASKAAADEIDRQHKKQVETKGWENTLERRREHLEKLVRKGQISPVEAKRRMGRTISDVKAEGAGTTGGFDLFGIEFLPMEKQAEMVRARAMFEAYGRPFEGPGAPAATLAKPAAAVTVNLDIKADTAQGIVDQVTGGLLTSLNRLFDAEARAQ